MSLALCPVTVNAKTKGSLKTTPIMLVEKPLRYEKAYFKESNLFCQKVKNKDLTLVSQNLGHPLEISLY
jgi:hypothetical protein